MSHRIKKEKGFYDSLTRDREKLIKINPYIKPLPHPLEKPLHEKIHHYINLIPILL